jgi:elongation factor G
MFQDCKINIIDTPGYADFITEVEAGLSPADLAVLVVNAVEGVEVQSEDTWHLAGALGIPRLVFVNKLDRERADFDRTVDQLRERFGPAITPLQLPIGVEADFKGIADLLSDSALDYTTGSPTTGPIPDDMSASYATAREALIEGIVVGNDELMEKYLEGEVPSNEALEATLASAICSSNVFPVICGSAITGVGIDLRARTQPPRQAIVQRASRRRDARALARSRRTTFGPCLQDNCRPVRRADLPHGSALGNLAPRHGAV